MKQRINKLVKKSKTISLSRYHIDILMDMAYSCGAVNMISPRSGQPNLAILLEAIAEGRLNLYDPESGEMIQADTPMAEELDVALEKDRKSNPLRMSSALMTRKSLTRIIKKQ